MKPKQIIFLLLLIFFTPKINAQWTSGGASGSVDDEPGNLLFISPSQGFLTDPLGTALTVEGSAVGPQVEARMLNSNGQVV